MSKGKQKADNQQAFGFASMPEPEDILRAVKKAITKAMKRTSRDELAGYLTRAAGKEVTVDMINAWTAESKGHVPPPQYIVYICQFTGDTGPLRAMVEPLGIELISSREKELLELGQVYVETRKLDIKRTELNHRVEALFLNKVEGKK